MIDEVLLDGAHVLLHIRVVDVGTEHEIRLQEAGPGEARRDLGELREQMLGLGAAGRTMRFRMFMAPLRRVLIDTGEIPSYGWTTLVVLVSAFSGFIIALLSMVGEYVVRTLNTVGSDDSYHVVERVSHQ